MTWNEIEEFTKTTVLANLSKIVSTEERNKPAPMELTVAARTLGILDRINFLSILKEKYQINVVTF